MTVYFFGVKVGQDDGHFLHEPNDWRTYFSRVSTPWGRWLKLDGTLCPLNCPQTQGMGLLHHRDGWTAWAFWDRTGDPRGNSNSAFLAEGHHSLEEMQRLAKEVWPKEYERAAVHGFTLHAIEGGQP